MSTTHKKTVPPTLTLVLQTGKKSPKADCHIVLLGENNQSLAKLTDSLQQQVTDLTDQSQFAGKVGKTALRYANATDAGLLLLGAGDAKNVVGNSVQKMAKAVYEAVSDLYKTVTIQLPDDFDSVAFGQFSLALLNESYRFDRYKSKADNKTKLETVYLQVNNNTDYQAELDFARATFIGQSLTRDLANEPPNVCTPSYLADQARALAQQYPNVLTVKVLGEKDMAKLGMNCFLAVSQGSTQEGQFVIMEYNGQTAKGKKAKTSELTNPIVMLGKGITFDTGGISLKPSESMHEMKFDMGGAAAVLGMIKGLCEAQLPLQVVGALACAENMPAGNATRPGDIVTAMNGKTVEILNTDAEGRLVLCDSLVYLQRYQPKVIIDMATLTGAIIVALGNVRTGMFSNDEDVIFDLETASQTSYDRVWHMPLDDDYQELIDSSVADIQNIGGRAGGSVTAACFLKRFVEDTPWAHLDIAGTASTSGKNASGTGRPVPLLMHYLNRQVR